MLGKNLNFSSAARINKGKSGAIDFRKKIRPQWVTEAYRMVADSDLSGVFLRWLVVNRGDFFRFLRRRLALGTQSVQHLFFVLC